MKRKYITYDERLNTRLENIGFKRKNQNTFVKNCGNIVHKLLFSHSSHHEHGVKYYTIGMMVEFLDIEKLSKEIGVIRTKGWILNIGHILDIPSYYTWRLTETDPDERITEIVESMYDMIKTYALPFMNRYSNIETLLWEYEFGNLYLTKKIFLDRILVCMMYQVLGQTEKALQFIELTIMERKEWEATGHIKGRRYPIPTESLDVYLLFEQKFKVYLETLK